MYIGIHLAQVGLRSLTFDGDMRLSIFGRFVLFPAILLTIQVGVMQFFSIELPMKLQETFFPSINDSYIGDYAIIGNRGKCGH